MNEHLSAGDLELFVIDGLSAVRAAEVEAHVVGCEACSAALAGEARLEIAFEEIARAPAPRSRPAPRARPLPVKPGRFGFAVVTAGTLSLAAAWMLFLVPAAHPPQGEEPGGYTATASDATTAALDGRNVDPLDGG